MQLEKLVQEGKVEEGIVANRAAHGSGLCSSSFSSVVSSLAHISDTLHTGHIKVGQGSDSSRVFSNSTEFMGECELNMYHINLASYTHE